MKVIVFNPNPQTEGMIFQIHVGRESYSYQIEKYKDEPYSEVPHTIRHSRYPGDGFFMSSMHTNPSQALCGALNTIIVQSSLEIEDEVLIVYQHPNKDVLIEKEVIIEDGVAYNWKVIIDDQDYYTHLRASTLSAAIRYAVEYQSNHCIVGFQEKTRGLAGEVL